MIDRLEEIVVRLRDFVKLRDWAQFHDPKNLAMAVASEAGELLAELRWIASSDADAWVLADGNRNRVAMEAADVFPEMLVQMTATGEETGKLDIMLIRTAEFYEQRVTAAVDGLSSLIEPIAIVVLGCVIGVMLIALYLPIFTLGQAMKSGLLGH